MTWALVGACAVVAFLFSGIEAGILSVNRVRLRHRMKLGDRAAHKLHRLLARPERILVTVLLVTNLANIFAITLTTRQFVSLLGAQGYVVGLLVCLPFYLLGVELLPKSLFRRFPYRALAALSEPLRVADLILSPIVLAGAGLARWITGSEPGERKVFAGREDFKYFTREGERLGTLTAVERDMIHNVVDFRSVTARDVMIPMDEVLSVAPSATLDEAFAASRQSDLDRLPVKSASGEIIGLINVFEPLLDAASGRNRVQPYMRRIVTVGADEPAYQVVGKLRLARLSLAAVVDGEGKTVGVVSSEDIVRRLVTTATAEPAVGA